MLDETMKVNNQKKNRAAICTKAICVLNFAKWMLLLDLNMFFLFVFVFLHINHEASTIARANCSKPLRPAGGRLHRTHFVLRHFQTEQDTVTFLKTLTCCGFLWQLQRSGSQWVDQDPKVSHRPFLRNISFTIYTLHDCF